MSDAASRARLEQLQTENARLQRELDAFPAPSPRRSAAEAARLVVLRELAAVEGQLFSAREREAAARDAQDRQQVRAKGFVIPWWSSWSAGVAALAAFIATFNWLLRVDPGRLPLVPAAVVMLALPVGLNVARIRAAKGRRQKHARAALQATAGAVHDATMGQVRAPERER